MAALWLISFTSCQQEVPMEEEALSPGQEACTVSITLGKEPLTRSILPYDIENRLDNAFVLIQGRDGFFRYRYFDFTSASQSPSVDWRLPAGMDCTVYAVGNMGNIYSLLPPSQDGFDLSAFRFEVPPYSSLKAMPMARMLTLPGSELSGGEHVHLSISLQRLMARVNIRIDKSGITGGQAAQVLQSGSLHLRQVARALYPFRADGSRALGDADIFPGNTDYYTFNAAEAWNQQSEEITLYIAENRQGTGTGSSQAGKTPATGREKLATYLEYSATKDGASDGFSGPLRYRTYLGENETNDFNVTRDRIYEATLSLTWNGQLLEGDWRVTNQDLSDTRALVISAAEGSSVPMNTTSTKTGSAKVRKATPTAFYLNFFPTGTSGAPAHGRKDLDSWPFGWQAYVDGSAVYMVGTSGTVKNAGNQNLLRWSYNSENDCLLMEALPGAPSSADIHTLQFRTTDGRKASNIVYFTTSIPFEYGWAEDGMPNHVAQRGLLQALDADTRAVDAEGIFHLKDGYSSKVRLKDNGDGTAVVELIDGFTALADAIYIEDADGDRHCDVPLEARLPFFECSDLTPATNYIDAQGEMNFAYLQSTAGGEKTSTRMQVVDNGTQTSAVTAGNKLDMRLVDEFFPPKMESSAGRLSFDRSLNSNGSFTIFTHVHTYQGVSGLITRSKTFTADKGTVSMKNHGDRGSKNLSFVSWNPWWFWFQAGAIIHSGGVMNDYTLYHEPRGWNTPQAKTGWEQSPTYRPVETAEYQTSITNAIVGSINNIQLDASFQEDGGYLGSKVCTGNPRNVDPGFTPSTRYRLVARVTNKAAYDWKAMGNYLWFEQGHNYLPGSVWADPAITDDERKAEMYRVVMAHPTFILSGWMATEEDAWSYAPKGVNAAAPGAITGVQFEVESEYITSTWTLKYSMKDLVEGDIRTHNAGKVGIVMRIINPYNSASPSLDRMVAEAFVRLHLFVWPAVVDVSSCSPGYGTGASSGWNYSAFPYCYTEGKRIAGLDKYGFWNKEILLPAAETYTSISTTFIITSSAGTGRIGVDYSPMSSPTVWQFRNNSYFNGYNDTQRKKKLMTALSSVNSTTSEPFTFRRTTSETRSEMNPDGSMHQSTYEGLTPLLGNNTYYRQDSRTLFYDPTGNSYLYTYPQGTEPDKTDKLFVIHIGAISSGVGIKYYFDPARGFSD